MRKCNAILSALILALFLVHAILGAFHMAGVGAVTTRALAWTMVGLIAAHTALGLIFTAQTLLAMRKSGAPYFRENLLFWARRISGFLIMLLIFFHVAAFGGVQANGYRLPLFDLFRLITQLLLVAAVAVHVVSNVKPMLISFGVRKLRPRAGDLLFWLSATLLFAAAAFIVYYIRWNAL